MACFVYLLVPGKAKGCSTNTVVLLSALWCHHGQTGKDSSSSYEIEYVTQVQDVLNPKAHQNCSIVSKVTVNMHNCIDGIYGTAVIQPL